MDLSPLINVDKSLSDDTRLYRIIDFFSVSDMVENNTLMFTRTDLFQDHNEGIDILLRQLELATPESGCGMGWNNRETALKRHQEIKQSHYVSCWSRNPESVAIWSLYSPDLCSVRVETTVGQLKQAALELLNKYSVLRIEPTDEETRPVVGVSGKILHVHYEDLHELQAIASRRFKARQRIADRYKKNGKKPPTLTEVTPRYFVREKARRTEILKEPCRLKDRSFEHEHEVRVIVRLGETGLIKALLEDKSLADPSHKYHHSLFARNLEALEYLSAKKVPEREFVKTNASIVNSVAIDPRCPAHKAKFMKQWFEKKQTQVVASKCFGYMTEKLTVFPDW